MLPRRTLPRRHCRARHGSASRKRRVLPDQAAHGVQRVGLGPDDPVEDHGAPVTGFERRAVGGRAIVGVTRAGEVDPAAAHRRAGASTTWSSAPSSTGASGRHVRTSTNMKGSSRMWHAAPVGCRLPGQLVQARRRSLLGTQTGKVDGTVLEDERRREVDQGRQRAVVHAARLHRGDDVGWPVPTRPVTNWIDCALVTDCIAGSRATKVATSSCVQPTRVGTSAPPAPAPAR